MAKLLRKIAGGLATGAGNYLVQKATNDAATAREDRLYQRELALKELDNKQAMARIDRQGEWQIKGTEEQGKQTRLTTGVQASAQIQRDRVQGQIEQTAAERKAALEKDIITLKANLDGRNERDAIRLRADIENKQNPPSEVIKTDFGSFVIFKDGSTKAYQHGHAPTGEGGGEGVDSFRPGAKPAAPAGKAPAKPDTSPAAGTVRDKSGKTLWPDGDGWRDAQGKRYMVNAKGDLVPR